MLTDEEQRALNAISVELTQRHPELAAALSFSRPAKRPSSGHPRLSRWGAAVVGLTGAAALTFAWSWGSVPPGPCAPGEGMTNGAALTAAVDVSRPMPDNVGCVMPIPDQPG